MYSPASLVYASFGMRAVAKIIDFIIIAVLNTAFTAAWSGPAQVAPDVLKGLFAMSGLLFIVAYNAGFVERFGATPGKLLLKLRVVQAGGEPLGPGRAFARASAELLSGWTCYIGYLVALFNDEHRALHDMICNTRVVYQS
jgi:uncharacterized RDD family membrane protein YckC